MSGICGVLSPSDPALATPEILARMLDAMRHRSRVGVCSHVDERAGLALGTALGEAWASDGEPAPHWHADGDTVVALDGAILRPLPADARAIAARIALAPGRFLDRVDGPFALGAWRASERTLWLAREALGTKPLYFSHVADRGLTVFASELKAVLAHPAVRRRVDAAGLAAFLSLGYIPAPLTIYDGIAKVFPGELVTVDGDGRLLRRRHAGVPRYATEPLPFAECVRRFRAQVVESIDRHVAGAGRVGVFLSGGLDSTIVLAILAQLGIRRRDSFTLGFHVDGQPRLLADLDFARGAARTFGCRHREIVLDQTHDLGPLLPSVLQQFDEPMLTPNAYSKYLLCRAAREGGTRACLSGSNAEYCSQRMSDAELARLRRKAGPGAGTDETMAQAAFKFFPFEQQASLLARPAADPREVVMGLVRAHRDGVEADEFANLVEGTLARLQGAEKSIAVQDRLAALAGVEIRHPLFDVGLFECSNRIPPQYLGSGSGNLSRAVLKAAFQDLVPAEILAREPAGYPCYYWNRGELERLKQRLLSAEGLSRTALFRPEAVQQVLAEDAADTGKSAGKLTWGLLVLQAWYELHVNGEPELAIAG